MVPENTSSCLKRNLEVLLAGGGSNRKIYTPEPTFTLNLIEGLTFVLPGFLEDAGGGILRVPLEPALRFRRINGIREAAADIDGGHEDGFPRVGGLEGHLADGVAVLDAAERLVLRRDLVVILGRNNIKF